MRPKNPRQHPRQDCRHTVVYSARLKRELAQIERRVARERLACGEYDQATARATNPGQVAYE